MTTRMSFTKFMTESLPFLKAKAYYTNTLRYASYIHICRSSVCHFNLLPLVSYKNIKLLYLDYNTSTIYLMGLLMNDENSQMS